MLAPILAALIPFTAQPSLATQANPVTLAVDARMAARGLLTVHERIPVNGAITLVYPKWIPGEHGPTGPLNNLAALSVHADGASVAWHRDTLDPWTFHVDAPSGARAIDVDFDVLMNAPGDVMAARNVAIINWNRVLLYQDGIDSHEYYVKPSIDLPAGWQFGTALRSPSASGGNVSFALTPLNMLVDSPLDMGSYVKKLMLFKNDATYVEMDVFADNPQDLDIPDSLQHAYERVPAEAFALYGSRHFADYHALLSLSDTIGFQGIEHHQSSDDRAGDDFLTDPDESIAGGDLVTHEFSHSWNGKYRRPDDLTTPNFQVPQQTDLLWVYEGMNQYLGDLLSFRSGIRDNTTYPQYLASIYATMDTETGRDTTPLIDLTAGAPYYYMASGAYHAIRRGAGDFYTEGELVWLDADTIIREQTHGAKSLDTFLHLFTAPDVTGPIVKTYTRADVEGLLNEVAPYDWHGFFDRYVYSVSVHPPTDMLARAGWKLVYTDKPNEFIRARVSMSHSANDWYSIGANISGKGNVADVRQGSPAWDAGLAVGDTIVAVNGQAYSSEYLDDAMVASQRDGARITLLVQQDGWFTTLSVDYRGGPRYPHLERIANTPDMLGEIMKPHAQ